MTATKLIRVKVPVKISRALPSDPKARSLFIVSALEEKIWRQRESEWQPTTERGRRMKFLLDAGAAERGEPLDDEGIARELRERRGSLH